VGEDEPVTDHDALPFVDEQATTIEAEARVVRVALLATLDRSFSRRGAAAYARAVGCVPHDASGPRPLAPGSSVPGFAVTASSDGEVVLEGRHRFSTYRWIFRLDATGDGRTLLRAETRAAFPGVTGGLYRMLVIGSRGHATGTRRLLAGVRRQAESGAA
jgi:hypothetical protein